MGEKPILFSGAMVRAILAGTKTQTRRIVQSPAKTMQREGMTVIKHRAPGDPWYRDHVWSMRGRTGVWGDYTDEQFRALCPYGAVGDRLWVRETWAKCSDGYLYRERGDRWAYAWRPSIFMPREASRITIEITGVRVERLQDISEEDARAEGVSEHPLTGECADQFSVLWDEINGERASWESDPWVWAITFKRVQP